MASYNLTQRQKDLLRNLIDGIRNKGWNETFLDMSTLSMAELLPIEGGDSIPLEDIEDMNVIELTGLIMKQYSRKGTARYTITQAAYDAVDQDFQILETQGKGNQFIGVQVHGDVGGSVQGIGYANEAEIQQILDDPELLQLEIEKLTSALLDVVKKYLSGKKLTNYVESISELQDALQNGKADESRFRKLIAGLSFINDTGSSIELISKAFPYIALLTQFGARIFIN